MDSNKMWLLGFIVSNILIAIGAAWRLAVLLQGIRGEIVTLGAKAEMNNSYMKEIMQISALHINERITNVESRLALIESKILHKT